MSTPIAWTEVRVLVPVGWQELVAEKLMTGPCTSAAFGRPTLATDPAPEGFDFVRTFLPNQEDTPEARAGVREILDGLGAATGMPELENLEVLFKELPPEDYATSWRKTWKPFRVGRLAVIPDWSDLQPREGDVRLTLEPGGAFGSGRHVTTRTCLKLLQDHLQGGERVLDAGSGSGILSVAAVLLGAGSALGFDIDPYAATYAEALARDNDTSERCAFRTGGFEVLGDDERDFDVVLGNIYSDILQAHARDLSARLAPTGWFALSGCPAHHREPTEAAIRDAGWKLEEVIQRGRWVSFFGRGEGA